MRIVNQAIRASVRAFGPIPVDRRSMPTALAPAHRGLQVDLGQWRGQEIPLAQITILRLLGRGRKPERLLLDVGVFKLSAEHSSPKRQYWLYDPAKDAVMYYEEWAANRPMPRHHEEFRIFERVRRCLSISKGHPFPENLLEGVFQKLSEYGNFCKNEVRGLLSVSEGELQTVLRWLDRRLGQFCAKPLPLQPNTKITLATFRRSLPEPIANAPRTCFAKHRRHEYEPPRPEDRERAWNLRELRNSGSLYALFASARMRRLQNVSVHMRVFERVEDIMRNFASDGQWTAATYLAALRAYAVDKSIRPTDLPDVRYFTVRMWRYMVARMHLFAKQVDPAKSLGLWNFLPPRIKLSSEFRKQLTDLYGGSVAEGQRRRKRDSDALLADLDAVLDGAFNRRDLMIALGEAGRAEMDAMLPHEEWRRFPVHVPVLDERGALTGRMVKIDFKLWRRTAAWRSFANEPHAKDSLGRRDAEFLSAINDRFVFEFIPRGKSPVNTSDLPWMLQFSIAGVLNSPRYLDWESRALRHETIVANKLPGWKVSAAGLLTFDRDGQSLLRMGRAVNRHFFPLEETEHAIRLACHTLDCVAQTFRRSHEVRQQLLDPWVEDPSGGALEVRHVQMVFGKIPGRKDLARVVKLPLRITEAALNEAIDLCELHVRRCGYVDLPMMTAPDELGWKCPPGQYVISYNGMAIRRSPLNTFLRYLLAGWPPYVFHDFRHALAGDAALDHEPLSAIAVTLGDNEHNAGYYASLPHWAQDIVAAEDQDKRLERQDERVARR